MAGNYLINKNLNCYLALEFLRQKTSTHFMKQSTTTKRNRFSEEAVGRETRMSVRILSKGAPTL